MKNLGTIRNQKGQGYSEYAIILVLIVAAGMVVWKLFGDQLVAYISRATGMF